MDINGLRVSRETRERLEHFAALFQKWAKSINLVAPSTLEALWSRHIADSVGVFQLYPGAHRWADLGSGGGFPGIITAILLAETGDGWAHLVESNHKKAAFLRVALSETGARGSVHALRIEDAPKIVGAVDAVSARALAELDLLFTYSAPWMCEGSRAKAIFHKGRDYEAEVAKARGRWDFDLLVHKSKIEADSVLLEITNLAPKSSFE